MKMLPEQRINSMPFTFNLMNLLPKCQQAEMLFSTFIQGALSKSRKKKRLSKKEMQFSDLSWSFPNSYEGFSYLDTANNLLMSMAFESLLKCHDSELNLSHLDSKMFLDFLRNKERDPKVFSSSIPLQTHSEGTTFFIPSNGL